jgi:hypothetical protein
MSDEPQMGKWGARIIGALALILLVFFIIFAIALVITMIGTL